MDAALRLGDRHPLHAVHAAFVLQPRPHAVRRRRAPARLDRDRHVLAAAEAGHGRVDDLGLPAPALGVPQVHAQQVTGEYRRLIPARARAYLQKDIAFIARIARQQ
jgi:hypothetical protein